MIKVCRMRPQRPQVSAHACAVIKKQEAVAMAALTLRCGRRNQPAYRDRKEWLKKNGAAMDL